MKEKIKDQIYYENFVGLAKQIEPDGEDVKIVGFNFVKNGQERPVALRKKKIKTSRIKNNTPSEGNIITLIGTLMHANSPRDAEFGSVKLWINDSGKPQNIKVPISLMKDVVQPYFEETVIIQAHKENGRIVLDEISSFKG